MKLYTFTLGHDSSKVNITLLDTNLHSATHRIMLIESCPECAILNIKIKDVPKKKN